MLKVNGYKVKVIYNTYVQGHGLYAGLECLDGEPYCDLTTNLIGTGYLAGENCGFVRMGCDYGTDFVEWLEKNGIAKRTGRIGYSGFCSYAEMKFNK